MGFTFVVNGFHMKRNFMKGDAAKKLLAKLRIVQIMIRYKICVNPTVDAGQKDIVTSSTKPCHSISYPEQNSDKRLKKLGL